jgi:integration host factor subunit alpha
MTLTKSHIIENIYNNCGYSKTRSTELTETVLGIIKDSLESGEHVLISGFGKFYLNNKKERIGRNPATGNDLTLEARRVVCFRCSSTLREKINGNE